MKLDRNKIKKRIIEIGYRTGCQHVASALSCVDVLCSIYEMPVPKIVILSKGHGVLAQYVILNEMGKLPSKLLETYYTDGGLSGHATIDVKHGVYASTGSLGKGLSIGIGYAIANTKKLVIVVLGDGELDEGSTLESLRIIQKLKIKNILAVVDYNGWQGFSRFCDIVPAGIRPYYSVKGEGLGVDGTLQSHYTKVNEQIYNISLLDNEQEG